MKWQFPQDVRGWLTPAEGLALSELSFDKAVLEIGSFCGLSTICMAQTAEIVHAVDPFDCRATPHEGDGSTLEEFTRNVERYGVGNRVIYHKGTSGIVNDKLRDKTVDLVFIDGNHSRKAVLFDAKVAKRVLRPGGLAAFHDYKSPHDPEVVEAVDELIANGARLVRVVGTIVVLDLERCKLTREEPAQVALAMCRRGPQINDGAAEAFYRTPTRKHVIAAMIKPQTTLLTHGFNIAWAEALNVRDSGVSVTHFAMIHDDIEPDPFWIDTLIAELEEHDADACSAIVPIKHDKGCTSTAVATDDRWSPRRLTMHEVFDLPETITAEDVGGPLLLNTGLWVVKITEPWAEKVCFRFENRIRHENGRHTSESLPEDWLNSYDLNDWGCKLVATRKVKLVHNGSSDYPNDRPWGAWNRDEAYYNKIAAKERELCGSSS